MLKQYEISNALIYEVRENGSASIAEFLRENTVRDGTLSAALMSLRSDTYDVTSGDTEDIVVTPHKRRGERWGHFSEKVEVFSGDGWGEPQIVEADVDDWSDGEALILGSNAGLDLLGQIERPGDGGVDVATFFAGPSLASYEFVVRFSTDETGNYVAVTTFPSLVAFAKEAEPFIRMLGRAQEFTKWRKHLLDAEYAEKADPYLSEKWEEKLAFNESIFVKQIQAIRAMNKTNDNPFD